MALKALTKFQTFDMASFLKGKRLAYLKAESWSERDDEGAITNLLGSKVTVQIIEDATDYGREVSNFGEQLVIKVRGTAPESYAKLKPLGTEVAIEDVEKAIIWGDFRNQLSVIAKVVAKS